MTCNRTLSHTICVENPFCDMHVRARKDEGEGILREGILGSSSQFMRDLGEKLFSEKLFSKPGCLRKSCSQNPFSAKLFYASQPRSCSCRSRSTRRGSASPYPEGATPTLSTLIENQNHADWVRLRTDDHNQRSIMKTLAKVGATSNSLWWAINGVGLLFAATNATVRESPYTDMILL